MLNIEYEKMMDVKKRSERKQTSTLFIYPNIFPLKTDR